jgi:hypothetical protein
MEVLLKQSFGYFGEGVQAGEAVDEVAGGDDVFWRLQAVCFELEALFEVGTDGVYDFLKTGCSGEVD